MTSMAPADARTFWKALMDNASTLITDARLLLEAGSFGRARSLTVLAQEELGKALWIYEEFERSWSTGNTEPRAVDRLGMNGRSHIAKYASAYVFGDELAEFWGHFDVDKYTPRDGETEEEMFSRWKREAEDAATEANLAKQAGFYVDRATDGTITAPSDVDEGTIPEDLQTAAQVIEMMLIKDHTRMKHDASTPYDSTHAQQFRLLPISHPEDWAAASEAYRNSGGNAFPTSGSE